jgi:hypothetical protein
MSIESQDDLAEDEIDTWQRRIDRYIDFASRGRVPPLRPPVAPGCSGSMAPTFPAGCGGSLTPAEPAGAGDPRVPLSALEVDGIRPRGAAQLGHHLATQRQGERLAGLYPLEDDEGHPVDNILLHVGSTLRRSPGLGA